MVSDVDSGGNLSGATVSIGSGFITGDTLEIGGQTSGTITDSGGTIDFAFTGSTLTLSGTDTLADYQAALDAVTYSSNPSNGDATVGGTDTSRHQLAGQRRLGEQWHEQCRHEHAVGADHARGDRRVVDVNASASESFAPARCSRRATPRATRFSAMRWRTRAPVRRKASGCSTGRSCPTARSPRSRRRSCRS